MLDNTTATALTTALQKLAAILSGEPTAPVLQPIAPAMKPAPQVQACVRNIGPGSFVLHVQEGARYDYAKFDIPITQNEAKMITKAIIAGGDQVTTSLYGSDTPYIKGVRDGDRLVFGDLVFLSPTTVMTIIALDDEDYDEDYD